MDYSIEWKDKICIITLTGSINIKLIERINKEFHGDKRTYEVIGSIWDFSNCNTDNVHADELRYTVAVDLGGGVLLNNHKMAIVVIDPHSIEIVDKYVNSCVMGGSPWKFGIHDSLDKALEWVNG